MTAPELPATLAELRSTMPDVVWIAIVAAIVFVVVYRMSAASAKAERSPRGTAPSLPKRPPPESPTVLPRLAADLDEEEAGVDPTKVGALASRPRVPLQAPTHAILADQDAAVDEPTHAGALILVTGIARTDKGKRRKRNEDSVLALAPHGVYAVADGMGGYRGGEIASSIAVKALEEAFVTETFEGVVHEQIPRRASELARAIQSANEQILRRAEEDGALKGMGTTICAARFSPNKQRLYVGHVGDSRMYRLRNGALTQITSDHTMKDLGVVGDAAAHLSRAVGIWPTVPIDVILCKPRPRDLYLLCSDGLNKMLTDAAIAGLLAGAKPPPTLAEELIQAANESGGKDNVSVIVIRVDDPAAPHLSS